MVKSAKQREKGGKGREGKGVVHCRKGIYQCQEVKEIYEKRSRVEWRGERMLSKPGKEEVRSEAESGGTRQGGGNGKEEKLCEVKKRYQ